MPSLEVEVGGGRAGVNAVFVGRQQGCKFVSSPVTLHRQNFRYRAGLNQLKSVSW